MENHRDSKFSTTIEHLKEKAKSISKDFNDFTNGTRVLLLLQRTKDGGHNKEEERAFETFTTTNNEEFEKRLFQLLLIKATVPQETRIYLSVNPRKKEKVIRYIEQSLLDAHYSDQTQREYIYNKLLKKQRHFLMQQSCRDGNLFIIDIDNEEGKDNVGEAIKRIDELGIEEVKRYKTKNGWHFVTKPFNPNDWKCVGEIKKDGLILLNY